MENTEADRTITKKLRELRRARGLTVDTLAKKIGEDSQKVGRIERGTRSITLDYLVKVSNALGAPLESFLEKDTKNEGKKNSFPPTEILNSIVIRVEEYQQKSPFQANKKALMISKIYELVLKFPEAERKVFIDSLFEFMSCLEV
ncbi:MAG: helix-turn-helix domain-containing protein [Chlamydiales bacterium]